MTKMGNADCMGCVECAEQASPSDAAPRTRRGVTMIELMVSLVIVSIGLLALASGATLVTRLMGGGATQTRAAAIAYTKLEQLRAIPCGSITNGTETLRGVVTQWTTQSVIMAASRRGMSVTLTVQYPAPGSPRTQTYRTVLPC
jgi:prepilin-type N-terminal cleavage/methylation domain-containing protein